MAGRIRRRRFPRALNPSLLPSPGISSKNASEPCGSARNSAQNSLLSRQVWRRGDGTAILNVEDWKLQTWLGFECLLRIYSRIQVVSCKYPQNGPPPKITVHQCPDPLHP